jgi:LuxR family maltose regulon positive regulatory protein
MSASWLLKGKILPPKQLVAMHARGRLISRLTSGRARRLTMIEAPAGFGKTTLLAQWRELLLTERMRVAWLTLDADDTADRLVAYIALSLQGAGVDLASTGLLSDDPRGWPAGALALPSILDALARDARAVLLIFDDLERLTDQGAQRQLDTLIQYAPDNLHIAIAARSNPGLSLAHLSLRGLVNHLDATSLRFTPAETNAYLNGSAAAIDLRVVMERADGWPVALQILRSMATRGQVSGESLGGDCLPTGLAASYLTEQLVRGLAPHQLSFLCDISLLDEVTLALADHVRGASDSARILRELDYLSALIPPLDGAPGHVRLHPMVREHFAALADADHARCALINRRAALWFAAAQKLPTALRHAVAAGDKMLTGTLIVQAGGVSIWIRHGMVEVVAASQLIDDDMIAAMPRLGLMRSIVLIKQSRLHEARAQYEQVAAATEGFSRDPSTADATALRREGLFILSMLVIYCCLPLSEAHLLSLDKGLHDPEADDVELAHHKTVLCVTYLQSGNFDAAWRYGEEAAAHCRAFGSIYGTNFIDFHLGSIAMARGDAQQAVQLYEKGRRKSRRHFSHDVGLRLIGDVLTAELDLERNAILYVKRRLARVIDRLHDAEAWFEIYAAAYGAASEVCLLERGLDETLGFLDQAQARAEHLRLAKLGPLLEALRVTTLTLAGDTDRALDLTKRSSTNFSEAGLNDGAGAAWREVESLSTAWVRLMLRHGRWADAMRTADRARSFARAKGVARMELRLNVLAAMCADAMGDRAGAIACIGKVCGEVARTGYLRAVLREGAELAPLLREAARALPSDTLRRQALDLEELLTGHAKSASRTPVFSPRELEVLRHLMQGMQDKVIARRLGVSEHAVRFHLKNIYAKTRVRGRFEAVARARELGVLDSIPS